MAAQACCSQDVQRCFFAVSRSRVSIKFSDGTEAVAHYYILPAFGVSSCSLPCNFGVSSCPFTSLATCFPWHPLFSCAFVNIPSVPSRAISRRLIPILPTGLHCVRHYTYNALCAKNTYTKGAFRSTRPRSLIQSCAKPCSCWVHHATIILPSP